MKKTDAQKTLIKKMLSGTLTVGLKGLAYFIFAYIVGGSLLLSLHQTHGFFTEYPLTVVFISLILFPMAYLNAVVEEEIDKEDRIWFALLYTLILSALIASFKYGVVILTIVGLGFVALVVGIVFITIEVIKDTYAELLEKGDE